MGKVIMSGIVPQLVAPVAGTPLGDLAVGSIVKLNESGNPVDYLVVNQGIPSNSSLYDASCNGTWLLRKDIYDDGTWHSTAVNKYANSRVHTYLNGTFYALLDSAIQLSVLNAKIPYCVGYGDDTIMSGSNGLSTKIFLLSCSEVGASERSAPAADGAVLSWFADNSQSKRVAESNDNGEDVWWYLRTPTSSEYGEDAAHMVSDTGSIEYDTVIYPFGIRPALILLSDILINDDGTIKV